MAHPQHNFTSNFNGSDGHNAELTLNINGVEKKYTPAGNGQTYNVPGVARIGINLDGADLVQTIQTALDGAAQPVLVEMSIYDEEYVYQYIGEIDGQWYFGTCTTEKIVTVTVAKEDGAVNSEQIPVANGVVIVESDGLNVYSRLRTALALGQLPVLSYVGANPVYAQYEKTADNGDLIFVGALASASDTYVQYNIYTVASNNTVTVTTRAASAGGGGTPDDENGFFNSSLYNTPGDGVTESLTLNDFRIKQGTSIHGSNIEFVPTHQEGGIDFGEVYLNPGTYILNIRYTLQWVGNPRGTFLPLVCNVGGQPFDFSFEQENTLITSQIRVVTARQKVVIALPFDADTPSMGIWVETLSIAQLASNTHPAVVHDTTLTGSGKAGSPLGVTTDAFGKIKDIPTSISQFRTGDVIPVDGPNGPAKMGKDDLLTETAQNALAGNVAPAFDPTRTSENPYKAGERVVCEGKTYTFKVDHYGVWNAADVYQGNIKTFDQITKRTKNLVCLAPKNLTTNSGLRNSVGYVNLLKISGTTTNSVNNDILLDVVFPFSVSSGKYTFSVNGTFTKTGTAIVYLFTPENNTICYNSINDGKSVLDVVSPAVVAKILVRFINIQNVSVDGNVQIEVGSVATPFEGYYSANDFGVDRKLTKAIDNVRIDISQFTEKTKNLVNIKPSPNSTDHGLTFSSDLKNRVVISGAVDGSQADVYLNLQDDITLVTGSYAFSIQGSFAKSGSASVYLMDGANSAICYNTISNAGVSVLSVPSTRTVHRILLRFFTDESTVSAAGNLQLEAGASTTAFENSVSAVDYNARLNVDLLNRTSNNHIVPIFNNGTIYSGIPDYSNYNSCIQWLVTQKIYHVKKGSYIKYVGSKNVYLIVAKFVNGEFVSNVVASNFTDGYYFNEDMDVRLAIRFTDYSAIVPADASEIEFNLYSNDEQKNDLEIYFIGIGSGLNNSSGYAIIAKLPNGKNLVVDSHLLFYYNAFANALRNAGVRKIDYYVQTHYHGDHIGILNVLQYYSSRVDIEESTAFLPPEITVENIAQVVATGDNPQTLVDRQDALIGYLEANDCTIIRPNNTTDYDLGGGVKLRFYNTDHSVYSDLNSGYYSTNYNDWSICPQLIFGMNVVNLSSDIGPIGERKVAGTLLKANILTAPHHGWDNGVNNLVPAFINNVSPDVVISVDGSEHHPDNTESAASVMKATSAMQSYCEANAVPNYLTCLNGPIKVVMNENTWKFDGTYSRYIRNGKNWSFTDNSEHIEP